MAFLSRELMTGIRSAVSVRSGPPLANSRYREEGSDCEKFSETCRLYSPRGWDVVGGKSWDVNSKVKGPFYLYIFDLARSGAPKVKRYAHGMYFYTFDLGGIRGCGGLEV